MTYIPVPDDEAKSMLGEGFHTAFRKATDGPQANEIHSLIEDMPSDEWDAVLAFVVWGLGVSGWKLCREETP